MLTPAAARVFAAESCRDLYVAAMYEDHFREGAPKEKRKQVAHELYIKAKLSAKACHPRRTVVGTSRPRCGRFGWCRTVVPVPLPPTGLPVPHEGR